MADAYERALSELVDKIVPGLDTGDLLADAKTASEALDQKAEPPDLWWNAIFEAGWRIAAAWAKRDDLKADIGSPAYLRDRDAVRVELRKLTNGVKGKDGDHA